MRKGNDECCSVLAPLCQSIYLLFLVMFVFFTLTVILSFTYYSLLVLRLTVSFLLLFTFWVTIVTSFFFLTFTHNTFSTLFTY